MPLLGADGVAVMGGEQKQKHITSCFNYAFSIKESVACTERKNLKGG